LAGIDAAEAKQEEPEEEEEEEERTPSDQALSDFLNGLS
jgi:hypothetical protein